MMTALFRGHPELYLHTQRAHTTHYFKSKPSYAEVWALGVSGMPFHVQLVSLALMLIRLCASGFRGVNIFLAAPVLCTVFAAFSYYPTTCGLAFPVEFEERCGCCVLPNISLSPNNTLSDHASIKRRNECGHGVVQNACFDQKTILSGSFGDRSWSPKKAFSNTTVQSIQVRNPTAWPAFSSLATRNMHSYCS